MSSVAISEMILLCTSIILIGIISSTFISSMLQLSDTQNVLNRYNQEKLQFDFKIVYAYGLKNTDTVKVWVKNVGLKSVGSSTIKSFDLYFGPLGNAKLIPHGAQSPPSWTFAIVNDYNSDGAWSVSETIEITIKLNYTLGPGDYYIRFVSIYGSYDEYLFSVA